jgi:hypothetical protein
VGAELGVFSYLVLHPANERTLGLQLNEACISVQYSLYAPFSL